MSKRIFNFSAGPSALPLPVLERARDELVDFRGAGMSIMEMSHRGKIVDEMHNGTIANLRKLMGISDDYAVIFMGGGARSHFSVLAMNLLGDGFAEYATTGAWSKYALKEAKKLGDAREIFTDADNNFQRVPQPGELKFSADAAYVHTTSNNTIFGTQYHADLDTGSVPHVCDMSSDILSRPLDVSKYAMIYAGAQKNMGPAGVTTLIIRKDMLERSRDEMPGMFNYKTVADKNSMLNTPPVFPIYMVGLVVEYLLEQGGLAAMRKINEAKSAKLYAAIDGSDGFFRPHAKNDSRSHMNVTFRLPTEELEATFVEEATAASLNGLKGHRSVGGLRASIYNSVPSEAVDGLVGFMANFQKKHG